MEHNDPGRWQRQPPDPEPPVTPRPPVSYLADAVKGRRLDSATLMLALGELDPNAVMLVTNQAATVTLAGKEHTAATPEAALVKAHNLKGT